jgi:hypothetical protein
MGVSVGPAVGAAVGGQVVGVGVGGAVVAVAVGAAVVSAGSSSPGASASAVCASAVCAARVVFAMAVPSSSDSSGVAASAPPDVVGVTSGAAGLKQPVARISKTETAKSDRHTGRIFFMGHLLGCSGDFLKLIDITMAFHRRQAKSFSRIGGLW